MAETDPSSMPAPEAIWIALGITAAAVAATLGGRRRRRLLRMMRALADLHESRERIVAFGNPRGSRRAMSTAIRQGVTWTNRLIDELDDAPDL